MDNIQDIPGLKKDNKKPFIIFLLIAFIVGGLFFYFNFFQFNDDSVAVNYEIKGVPYFGYYNLFPHYNDPVISAVATVLHYYGDERFELDDLKDEFPIRNTEGFIPVKSSKIEEFFLDFGYEVLRSDRDKWPTGEEIKHIKKYVNKEMNIPVLVLQHIDPADKEGLPTEGITWRVVIGINDDAKKIIMHDHLLGKIELEYDQFLKLFTVPDARVMLTVWPTDELKSKLKGIEVNRKVSYPAPIDGIREIFRISQSARTLAHEGDTLCVNWRDGGKKGDVSSEFRRFHEESIKLRYETIKHPSFEKMSDLFKFHNKLYLARSLARAGKVSESKKYLLEEVIPINQNLEANSGFEAAIDPDELRSIVNGKMAFPFEQLAWDYLYLNQRSNAIDSFNKALNIDPDDARIKNFIKLYSKGSYDEQFIYQCIGGKQHVS